LDLAGAVGVVGVFNGGVALSVLTVSEVFTLWSIDGDWALSGVEMEVGDSTITDGVVWVVVGRDFTDPTSVLRATDGRGAEVA
jgi:hypothetical protein